MPMMKPQSVLLVTGTLAEPALRQVVQELSFDRTLNLQVHVLQIQVAALLTADWVARKLVLPASLRVDRVILPGYTRGDLSIVADKLGVAVVLGPRHLHDLPEFFGHEKRAKQGYGQHDLEIIAEINGVAHLPVPDILTLAQAYADDGADVIDLGCDPSAARDPWRGIGEVVRELCDRGLRVSVDSFHPWEVATACQAGAELVLSVNSTNAHFAKDWELPPRKKNDLGRPKETSGKRNGGTSGGVVVIPDDPLDLASLDRTIERLEADGVAYRLDPILEPIGLGFARSLGRYLEVRKRYPQAAMMMGVGNLTEMTEVDSAGVNALLAGFCQEQRIGSVLTTQVINWTRSSVRELNIARKLMHFAVTNQTPPKHLDPRLVMLRDPKHRPLSEKQLSKLASKLTDKNVRLFAQSQTGQLHAMKKGLHVKNADPFALFKELGIDDPAHAFYLGYEMAKADMAMRLHKNYVQDEPLRLGALDADRESNA